MDDRKTKMLNDERERERREAHAAAMARAAAAATSSTQEDSVPASPPRFMPGSGQALNGEGPPPYDSNGGDE
jgi:hypothetical protein